MIKLKFLLCLKVFNLLLTVTISGIPSGYRGSTQFPGFSLDPPLESTNECDDENLSFEVYVTKCMNEEKLNESGELPQQNIDYQTQYFIEPKEFIAAPKSEKECPNPFENCDTEENSKKMTFKNIPPFRHVGKNRESKGRQNSDWLHHRTQIGEISIESSEEKKQDPFRHITIDNEIYYAPEGWECPNPFRHCTIEESIGQTWDDLISFEQKVTLGWEETRDQIENPIIKQNPNGKNVKSKPRNWKSSGLFEDSNIEKIDQTWGDLNLKITLDWNDTPETITEYVSIKEDSHDFQPRECDDTTIPFEVYVKKCWYKLSSESSIWNTIFSNQNINTAKSLEVEDDQIVSKYICHGLYNIDIR